jgi:serine/threonine protein kinase
VDAVLKNPASVFDNGDITAGVGTRSYASPEQMKGGTEYDSSTDIYSLGIILFELCYPMYTGMERNIVLSNVRKNIFPEKWEETLGVEFPTLHSLLLSMISNKPEDRPTAHTVVQNIQSILEGFTITSLDKHDHEGAILLRVETMPREDVLRYTMDLIREAALPFTIDIAQYGLRGGSNKGQMKSIMEFAIVPKAGATEEEGSSNDYCPTRLGNSLVNKLNENPDVLLVRQVSATKYT